MELNKIFNNLLSKGNTSNSVFLADKISNSKNNIRLGIDSNKNPVLLIPEESFKEVLISGSNYKLNYLEIKFNQLCRINDLSDPNDEAEIKFSTIKLTEGNFRMIDYFLRALEGLVIQLNKDFTSVSLKKEIEILIELFSKQKSVDFKIVVGLWGELFFINQSSNITLSLEAWHNQENNRFDFSFADNEYLEIKTTLGDNRLHSFSSRQIENYQDLNVEVVSIQTELSSTGKSLKDLWDSMNNRIENPELKDKLQTLISKTLKSDFQALYDYKFDIGYAESSLKHFNTKDIPSINENLHHSIRKISLTIDLDLINS